ncbi:hypothetical protein [Candidatus Entotheonella palauensis]|uniref:hypothetical protein n=1 Tax=Candidatus Entotheonella palauensis TaxID=93172 RepID=UPI000B7DBE0C
MYLLNTSGSRFLICRNQIFHADAIGIFKQAEKIHHHFRTAIDEAGKAVFLQGDKFICAKPLGMFEEISGKAGQGLLHKKDR